VPAASLSASALTGREIL